MFNSKKKKLTVFALSAFMAVSMFGTTIASAHWNDDPPPPHHHYDNGRGHSQGEVTTAAILGAVAGAVIAKNT